MGPSLGLPEQVDIQTYCSAQGSHLSVDYLAQRKPQCLDGSRDSAVDEFRNAHV